jgi:hypothetical protein
MGLRKTAAGVGATSAVAALAVSGSLGVIVAGSILGAFVLLICLLAMVAVFGSPDHQLRAECTLRIILGREDAASGSAARGDLSSVREPAPDQGASPEIQGSTEATLVPIKTGGGAVPSGFRGLGRPAAPAARRRRPPAPPG